jgi:hypothetical protein
VLLISFLRATFSGIFDSIAPEQPGAGSFLAIVYAASAYLVAFAINNLLAPSYKPLNLDSEK